MTFLTCNVYSWPNEAETDEGWGGSAIPQTMLDAIESISQDTTFHDLLASTAATTITGAIPGHNSIKLRAVQDMAATVQNSG